MFCPSMQIRECLWLFLQKPPHFIPTKISTNVSDTNAVAHQKTVYFQPLVYLFCHTQNYFFCLINLILFNLCQLVRL
mgnify:CR=1 FL=1